MKTNHILIPNQECVTSKNDIFCTNVRLESVVSDCEWEVWTNLNCWSESCKSVIKQWKCQTKSDSVKQINFSPHCGPSGTLSDSDWLGWRTKGWMWENTNLKWSKSQAFHFKFSKRAGMNTNNLYRLKWIQQDEKFLGIDWVLLSFDFLAAVWKSSSACCTGN